MIPKSSLMTFDGWFVEKGKSIGGCVCHFLANSEPFSTPIARPPSPNASDRRGDEVCGRGLGRPTSLASYATAHSSDPPLPLFNSSPRHPMALTLRVFTVPSKQSAVNK